MTTPKTKALRPKMFENLGMTDRETFKAWCLKPVEDVELNDVHVSIYGDSMANLYQQAESSLVMQMINDDMHETASREELAVMAAEALYKMALLRVDGVKAGIGNVLHCAAHQPMAFIATCVLEHEEGNLVITPIK